MPADDFYPNGWPITAAELDDGDPGVFHGLLDPLVAAICRIKGCGPHNLSGRDRAKAERIVTDGLSQERFIQIIEDTRLRGNKWGVAVMAAWAEVKRIGAESAKDPVPSIKPTGYDAEKERAWATMPPLEKARKMIGLCEGWLASGKYPPGKDRGDANMMLRRARRELELWSRVQA